MPNMYCSIFTTDPILHSCSRANIKRKKEKKEKGGARCLGTVGLVGPTLVGIREQSKSEEVRNVDAGTSRAQQTRVTVHTDVCIVWGDDQVGQTGALSGWWVSFAEIRGLNIFKVPLGSEASTPYS